MKPDQQQHLIDRFSDDDLLDALGPDWSQMSSADRRAYAGQPTADPVSAAVPVAYPALTLWRAELRNGVRGQQAGRPATWRCDVLWRAACWEKSALDMERDGRGARWADAMRRAREILAVAVTARQQGAA